MKGKERIASMLAAPGTPHLRSTLASVLFLAWPAIIEQIMLTLVQYVDTAMVGSLGSNATAAVGVTSSTTWLFNGFFNAAAIGFSSMKRRAARRTPSASPGSRCALWASLGC